MKSRSTAFTKDPLWYKDAVIYQLHVKSFFDENNDGVGDFTGLIQKLDYIAALGVNTIWLLPFYPSPRKDDGYDIAEYKGIHPEYGKLADAKRFIAAAHKRGLRVVTELIINHTSDQHPWFQRARKAKRGSAARDFYVWSDTDTAYGQTRIIFTDYEKSNWTWDPVANAFYWHRFFSHQPDLNFDNPQVLKKILEVMRFWLDLGVDGLRLDAIPYLIEREGTSNENLPETHDILKKIRKVIDEDYPDKMLLAEANMWPEDVKTYFGDNDECHMAFHFPLMPRMYLALAQEDRFPITDILRQTPEIHPECQWAIFLRNHDELTLEMVSDAERAYMLNFYAAENRARLNVGIRRRLAPLLQRDRRRIELLNSLLLSMPGTPVIYYGDEIGMGDNIHLGDRDGVRTPMQWSPDRNGGFSKIDPSKLILPVNMDTQYGFQSINVEAQEKDRHSLLNWMRAILAVRKQFHVFGRGKLQLLYPNNRKVIAYLRINNAEIDEENDPILCIANLSGSAQAAELDLTEHVGLSPIELLGGSVFPTISADRYTITLGPYDFYWFRLRKITEASPSWPSHALPEYRTLVILTDIHDLVKPSVRDDIENQILPEFLPLQPWYKNEIDTVKNFSFKKLAVFEDSGKTAVVLTEIKTQSSNGVERRIFLPLAITEDVNLINAIHKRATLGRIRKGPHINYLVDALQSTDFAKIILANVASDSMVEFADTTIKFTSLVDINDVLTGLDLDIRPIDANEFKNSIVIGEQILLRVIRDIDIGINPSIEMLVYLRSKGFEYTPQILGSVSMESHHEGKSTQIVIERYIHNQGNAAFWLSEQLKNTISTTNDQSEVMINVLSTTETSQLSRVTEFSSLVGKRLADMHGLLASAEYDTEFAPHFLEEQDVLDCCYATINDLHLAIAALRQNAIQDIAMAKLATHIVDNETEIEAAIKLLSEHLIEHRITRIHGNLHLENILVIAGDIRFIGFDGDKKKPLQMRRLKGSPLEDLACLLISYVSTGKAIGTNATQLSKIERNSIRNIIKHTTDTLLSAYFEEREQLQLNFDIKTTKAKTRYQLRFFMLSKVLKELITFINFDVERFHSSIELIRELMKDLDSIPNVTPPFE